MHVIVTVSLDEIWRYESRQRRDKLFHRPD
jgi:hypothetical protein